MPHDFELYSNAQEPQLDFHTSQPFIPASSYAMDQPFTTSFDSMIPLAEAPRPQDLQQFHYDVLPQTVKPFHYQSPAASPHSSSHSFHEQPPVLSASPESGASVSSSVMHSPSLAPQFHEPWGLGLTAPGFEYSGMVATEKSFVDPNLIQPFAFGPHSPYPELRTPYFPVAEQPPSPALSHISSQSQRPGSARIKRGSASPYLYSPDRKSVV